MINFTAIHIHNTSVKKNYSSLEPKQEVAFVELHTSSRKDRKTLGEISKLWAPCNRIADSISLCAEEKYKGNLDFAFDRFFALTKPQSSYSKLDPANVLGIAHASETHEGVEIYYLQTGPKYEFANSDRSLKQVGHRIIKCIKSLYKGLDVIVAPKYDAEKFYYKIGFKDYGNKLKLKA